MSQQSGESSGGINKLYLTRKRNMELLKTCKLRHMIKILRIQRNYRRYKTNPKKINIKRFKSAFLAALKGWRIRRIFATLRNDEKVREAIDIIKLHEDTKKKGNSYFKQIIDKYPEMMELFHTKLNQLIDHKGWFDKPITKVKVLTNKHVLKSKRFDILNMKKHKSKESSAKSQLNDTTHEESTSSKNIPAKDSKPSTAVESKKLKIPAKKVQNKTPILNSRIPRKY